MVLQLYVLKSPILWSYGMLGIFFGVKNAIFTVGLLIGPLLIHKLQFTEITVVLLSLTSQFGMLILLSFAKTGWMVFLAGAIGIFSNLYIPNVKTIIATVVDPNEIGQIYAWLNLSINVAIVAASFAAGYVYEVTVDHYAGTAFLVIAGFILVAGIATVWVYFDLQQKTKKTASQSNNAVVQMIYLGKF